MLVEALPPAASGRRRPVHGAELRQSAEQWRDDEAGRHPIGRAARSRPRQLDRRATSPFPRRWSTASCPRPPTTTAPASVSASASSTPGQSSPSLSASGSSRTIFPRAAAARGQRRDVCRPTSPLSSSRNSGCSMGRIRRSPISAISPGFETLSEVTADPAFARFIRGLMDEETDAHTSRTRPQRSRRLQGAAHRALPKPRPAPPRLADRDGRHAKLPQRLLGNDQGAARGRRAHSAPRARGRGLDALRRRRRR